MTGPGGRQSQLLLEGSLRLEQKATPLLIQFCSLLQLSALELEAAIDLELAENPALEVEQERGCWLCGGALGSSCQCLAAAYGSTRTVPDGAVHQALPNRTESEWLRDTGWPMGGTAEYADLLGQIAAPFSLQDHLRWSLHSVCDRQDYAIARALIAEIDENGLFRADLEEVAARLGVPRARVERVLRAIQALDPIGVGARDLRECLLIQLRYLEEEEGVANSLARSLVQDHWDLFARRRYEKIARKLSCSASHVQAAADFIRKNLIPYPGRAFNPPWSCARPIGAPAPRPDIVLRRVEGPRGGYDAEVMESRSGCLRISRAYQEMLRGMREGDGARESDDREHVHSHVERARWFIRHLRQRRETLKRICVRVAERQREFLSRGRRYLRPLTRLQVARLVGLHESTVGRAVANKYVMLPSEETVPFCIFFKDSLPATEVLANLIAAEEPRKPLSDGKLVELLAAEGIPIARRTVAKYRGELGIPPRFQRRRFDSAEKEPSGG